MRLTPDEYRRGLIKWNPRSTVAVRTFASDDLDAPTVWSEPHTEPQGSKVLSPPGVHVELRIENTGQGELPFPVRWDRLSKRGVVQAVVLDPEPHEDQFVRLAHVPNYGIFHRLVVEATPTLAWEHDAVLRVDDTLVRFVTGAITGEQVSPVDEAEIRSDGFSLTSEKSGTVEVEGRFIEIVAPGENPETASLNANAILGLLALMFGASAAGNIVFSEPYAAARGEPQRGYYSIPVVRRVPSTVEDSGLDAIDQALATFLVAEPMSRAVRLALHWFERALRSSTPLDELLCSFVGIDALLNTYASVRGPIPEVEERKSLGPSVRALLAGHVDDAVIARLQNSLAHASVRDRFAFYVARRALEHRSVGRFDDLVDVRNRAFHGEPSSVTTEHAMIASGLLIAMLRKELDIDVELPWDVWPRVGHLELYWVFADYGFHGRRSVDEDLGK